jgi:hypothetical protein
MSQLPITCLPFVRYWRKKWEYNETVHLLLTDFRKPYDSVRMEVLHNILIQTGIHVKLFRLIKMCLNETYSEFRIAQHLSDASPIQNGVKKGVFHCH